LSSDWLNGLRLESTKIRQQAAGTMGHGNSLGMAVA
jgi:hypothetical protein